MGMFFALVGAGCAIAIVVGGLAFLLRPKGQPKGVVTLEEFAPELFSSE